MESTPHLKTIEIRGGHVIRVVFEDGVVADVDLGYLVGAGPVFEPLVDNEFFAQVSIDEDFGTICWPNGADIAPETLYGLARKSQDRLHHIGT